MSDITHIEGHRTKDGIRSAAAGYQALGYTTVQIGPSAGVNAEHSGLWPHEAGKDWFVLIASKSPMTAPAKLDEESEGA